MKPTKTGSILNNMILYGEGSLACRHCCELSYQSQHESPRYRGLHRAGAIRMKLGGSIRLAEPFPSKPIGMHWLTYAQLWTKEAEAAARFWPATIIEASGGKIGPRLFTADVVDRLLALADLSPEHTRGDITAQVNALRTIAEIEGYL